MIKKKIMIVHPYDRTTRFLKRINKYLSKKSDYDIRYINIEPNDLSHNNCIREMESFSDQGLIIFMGHGRSNCLLGAKADKHGALVDEQIKLMYPDEYYYKEEFINSSNIDVFKEKKVISISCNSNSKIGEISQDNGTKVFIGFGDLPTSTGELIENGTEGKVGTSLAKLEKYLKTEFTDIIKRSIHYSIKSEYNFYELTKLIKFITNQRISLYLAERKNINERKIIADYLYFFKSEIKIFGDGLEKLV